MSNGCRSGVVSAVAVLVLAGLVGVPPAFACPVSQQDELGRCPDDPARIKEEEEKKAAVARRAKEAREAEEARTAEAARLAEEARAATRARALATLLDGSSFKSISEEGSSGFLAMEHEVTQAEWAGLIGSVPLGQSTYGDRVPVASVSWCDVVVFANRLTAKANEKGAGLKAAYILPAGMDVGLIGYGQCTDLAPKVIRVFGANGFRLPTEAEWEHMAKGTGVGGFTVRSATQPATAQRPAVHAQDVCTSPKPRNGYGLCDLGGNVREWTGSTEFPSFSSLNAGRQVVVRGSDWREGNTSAQTTTEVSEWPSSRYETLGFRLVRSLP